MVEEYSLVIRRARIRGRGDRLYDIAVDEDKIAVIAEDVMGRGEIEIDADGGLVTEPFVNPHLHMCKVYTYLLIGEEAVRKYQSSGMESSLSAILIASRVKEKYREDWIYENASRALREAVRHGTLYIRAFVDTDTKARLEGIKALLRLRDKYRGVVDIQVVAFPQDGLIRDEGAEEYLWKAVEMGADVVGGIPWIEYSREYMARHIDTVFNIALEYDRDIAMLTDDTGDPLLDTTEMLALKTIEKKWSGRVTACHARALALKPKPYLERLAGLLAKAGVSLVSDPHTGPLYLPIKYMLEHGVNVALGQDDIADAYYPYGRNNMLEVAFLASHLTWSMTLDDMDRLLDMITWRAAKAIGLKNYGLREGGDADILVHRARSVYELIWMHEKPLYVIRRGRIIYRWSIEEEFSIE